LALGSPVTTTSASDGSFGSFGSAPDSESIVVPPVLWLLPDELEPELPVFEVAVPDELDPELLVFDAVDPEDDVPVFETAVVPVFEVAVLPLDEDVLAVDDPNGARPA